MVVNKEGRIVVGGLGVGSLGWFRVVLILVLEVELQFVGARWVDSAAYNE